MIPQKALRKLEVKKCAHCELEIKDVRVKLGYESEEVDFKLEFCSTECMIREFHDPEIQDRIDRAVRKELNWLHKQVRDCEHCRRKIQRAV